MKNLLLLLALMAISSCGLFDKVKGPIIEKASITAQKAAVTNLGCLTGKPVYEDVEKELNKILNVKQKELKSVAGTVCYLAVSPVVSELIDMADKKLPESWLADGCSLDNFEGDAKKLADKLCEKL